MPNIGWIGTGLMGSSMCMHLINAGYKTFIYNRTKEKAKDLIAKGAVFCTSPKEAAENSNIIFSIVGFPSDVREVILGNNGVLQNAKENSIIIDMTTSEPTLAKEIYDEAKKKKINALDAPVTGGDIGAKNAKLSIMVGGDKNIFSEALPYLKLMGENITYMGHAGSGQHTKMANQILIASTMVGVAESLLYAVKSGLDINNVIEVLSKGAAASWQLNYNGPRIAVKDYSAGFFIKHFVKDLNIALEEAKKMNLSLPGLASANQFYIAAKALGLEESGTQGLYRVFEKLNGL